MHARVPRKQKSLELYTVTGRPVANRDMCFAELHEGLKEIPPVEGIVYLTLRVDGEGKIISLRQGTLAVGSTAHIKYMRFVEHRCFES